MGKGATIYPASRSQLLGLRAGIAPGLCWDSPEEFQRVYYQILLGFFSFQFQAGRILLRFFLPLESRFLVVVLVVVRVRISLQPTNRGR